MPDSSAPGIVSQTLGMGMQTLPDEEEKRRKDLLKQVSKLQSNMVSNVLNGQGGLGGSPQY